MKSPVQLRLRLPGEAVTDSAGMTEAEIVEIAASALSDAPALRSVPNESALRAVVAWATSDREAMSLRDVADLSGVTDRTVQRWRAQDWWRPAVLAVVERMRPPGFRLLSAALDELAASLAADLRFGRRRLRDLTDAELKLVQLAAGEGREVTVTTADGTQVSVHDVRQDPELDALTSLRGSADVVDSEGVSLDSCRGATGDFSAGEAGFEGEARGGLPACIESEPLDSAESEPAEPTELIESEATEADSCAATGGYCNRPETDFEAGGGGRDELEGGG